MAKWNVTEPEYEILIEDFSEQEINRFRMMKDITVGESNLSYLKDNDLRDISSLVIYILNCRKGKNYVL